MKIIGFLLLCLFLPLVTHAQVDTTYIYDTSTPFGSLDIRIARSATNFYYLQEDKTFSFRESSPGVKTDTYRDMTSWDSSPYRQGNLRLKSDTSDNFVMNYRFLVPQGYNATYAQGYPIVIIFHGYGERGNCEKNICYHANATWSPLTNNPAAPTTADLQLLNNDHNLLHGGIEHLNASNRAGTKLPNDASMPANAFPGFVVFPQNLNGWDHFSVQDAIRILRLMLKKYNIDENRVYIQGISNGGHGMYEAIKRAPWLFAAAIGMSAVDDGFINVQGMAPKTAHIPLWIFQGGIDINPFPTKTTRYIQQFVSAGASVRYTLYPELGHGTWNTAWREPDFFTWLLDKNKTDIHSFEDSKAICSSEGTKLELAEGFMAYQWQFNGQIISGANTASYFAKSPGTYKARFSRVANPTENQWNPWSDPITLTVENPPVATIKQTGTVKLKDLNGKTNALLESTDAHTHYYWYKNNVLLDLPGAEDDTVKALNLAPSYGNGAYSLVVSSFGCKSAPSESKYVFFNDTAPTNITSPTGLQGVSSSASRITLTWKDVSSGENGFEIWRRKKNGTNNFSPWEMAGLTGPNATSFADQDLVPLSTYVYKIRAVSNTGRSAYFPAAAAEGVSVQTIVDTEAPTAPSELKGVAKGVQKLFFTWSPSTDNAEVQQYVIYLNDQEFPTGTADTSFLLTNVDLNREFEATVKASDFSGNLSAASNKVKVNTYVGGLFYEHSTGSWTTLDSINWSHAEFTGRVPEFTLRPKTQDDYFNFRFDGFILIENPGSYQFRTSSDDASRLRLNDKIIVDNNGIHEFKTVTSAATPLVKGPQRITVDFFDYTLTDTLIVEYKGADTNNDWAKVSYAVLKSDESVITGIGPDDGPEDSFIVNVFPNPTTQDNIQVQVETVLNEPVHVSLIDPVGRSLFAESFQPADIGGGIRIVTPGMVNTGIYLVVVEQAGVRVRQKVIIRR